MRIDVLLDSLCLVKTRSLAKKGCLSGNVRIGGAAVRPSRIVSEGDIVEIRRPGRSVVMEILEIPEGRVSKKEAPRYYRVIRETRTG